MIENLLRQKQTVFTFAEIANILHTQSDINLKSAVNYYARNGQLLRLSKGIYAVDENYSRFEMGNKLRVPSYISLYSVLQQEGVVFQPYTSIFLISNHSETIERDEQKYVYRKIKNENLLNLLGIYEKNFVFWATKERAILDKIYLDGVEHFDNLREVDWNLVRKLNREVFDENKHISEFIKLYRNAGY